MDGQAGHLLEKIDIDPQVFVIFHLLTCGLISRRLLGTIDSDELGSVMRSMGLQPSDEDVMDMIKEVCKATHWLNGRTESNTSF